MRKISVFFLITLSIILFVFSSITISADDEENDLAADITDSSAFTLNGQEIDITKLRNGSLKDFLLIEKNNEITVSSEEEIGAVYVQFFDYPDTWNIESADRAFDCGKNGFLHEFIDLSESPSKEISIKFDKDVKIAELYLFTVGETPDFVQKWQPSCEKADLLLLVSHSDDEHLFFAGVLPYYSAIGYKTQVVYLTNHLNNRIRLHEQLNSLWTAGVKYYPIIGPFPDLYSTDLENGYSSYVWAGYSERDFLDFEVEILRRFKPLVVFTHDFKGEYGHGTHMVCADILSKAIPAAADVTAFPASEEKYGVWDTPKVYFHLYNNNKIKLFFSDVPMDELGGHTPFFYSQQAYLCNISQLPEPSLTKWMCGTDSAPVTLASSILSYSPVSFGLYYTTVGYDTPEKGDPFENIISYTEQERIHEEELKKQMEEESLRLESQKLEIESMLAENAKDIEALDNLKNDYESIVNENDLRIGRLESITKGLNIASIIFFVIFTVMLLTLIVTRRNLKALAKRKKISTQTRNKKDENNNQ